MAYNDSVFILCENKLGFYVNSIKNILEGNNIPAELVGVDPESLKALVTPPVVILCTGENENTYNPITLKSIVDLCQTHQSKLILVGAHVDEIASLKQKIPADLVTDEFLRPMDLNIFSKIVSARLKDYRASLKKKHILVVDDSGVMLRSLMSLLEKDFQVSLANSATSAFPQIYKQKPDLILLDYEMPICSGAQFFEMLKAEDETKDIPVFFLTSKSDAETVREVVALKPAGYLLKTVSNSQLLDTLHDYFRKNSR